MIIDEPRREQLPELRSLWKEAFGDTDEFFSLFERTAFKKTRCRCITVGTETVAALYWFDCIYRDRPIAYLYAVATSKAHRGQGLCRALTEDTHRQLKSLGYAGTILVPAGEGLFAFYERLGYRICSYVDEFSCPASAQKAELRQISTDEYAKLRRKLLPVGGVIQENENLRFLQATAKLYAGEKFVFAGRCEGGILYASELLGDISAADEIVSALGQNEGRFRTVGNSRAFAMYHPLDGDASLPPPSYFGLAFD
ncbi:MAG: GNAT family N-acetyltransferase [Clostridia bacterium]|nr:GNAT family N-acetyltransferase [Clostridia bacterium]MBQ8850791.1 GNAT family N-acetyltransferase [Clostridia bacterium]